MARKEFSRKTKLEGWARCGGKCEHPGCGAKLMPGKFAYDHILADGLGGEPTLDNMAVLCSLHHSIKTGTHDVPMIAKAERQKAFHLGAKPKGRGFRSWRKFNGEIVRRDE